MVVSERVQLPMSHAPPQCLVLAGSMLVSYPDPTLSRGKGLVTFERFLGCASSAVLFSRKPIKLPFFDFCILLHSNVHIGTHINIMVDYIILR